MPDALPPGTFECQWFRRSTPLLMLWVPTILTISPRIVPTL
jgi:hypothetical protein